MRRSTVRWIAITLVAALILGVVALALIGLTEDPWDRPPRTPPVSLGMPMAPGPVEAYPL
jgi:hypothetical protein